MKQELFLIADNRALTADIYEMRLTGNMQALTCPGQFVNIALNGLYLRRPISVCDLQEHSLTLLYKVVGKGTAQMAAMKPGESLELLTGLGNGFNVTVPCVRPLLAGGGIGAAPLYFLAKELVQIGKRVSIVLGFNTKNEAYYIEEFEKLGVHVFIATLDGTLGIKGFVTDAAKTNNIQFDYFYACGPMPMLNALCHIFTVPGEVSLEARMGCGFGICMGCSIETKNGIKRICKEGPIFRKEELLW